jgi:xanthine dehydrogenase molybdopterin-binding subunit B
VGSVGASPRRREGPEKVCGLARYVDDLSIPGCLHVVTFRSTIACGRIKKISFDPVFPWRECVVARASDIPGDNYVLFFEKDQPLLADGVVRHMHEPILLIAHPDRAKAYEAMAHVKVEY